MRLITHLARGFQSNFERTLGVPPEQESRVLSCVIPQGVLSPRRELQSHPGQGSNSGQRAMARSSKDPGLSESRHSLSGLSTSTCALSQGGEGWEMECNGVDALQEGPPAEWGVP